MIAKKQYFLFALLSACLTPLIASPAEGYSTIDGNFIRQQKITDELHKSNEMKKREENFALLRANKDLWDFTDCINYNLIFVDAVQYGRDYKIKFLHQFEIDEKRYFDKIDQLDTILYPIADVKKFSGQDSKYYITKEKSKIYTPKVELNGVLDNRYILPHGYDRDKKQYDYDTVFFMPTERRFKDIKGYYLNVPGLRNRVIVKTFDLVVSIDGFRQEITNKYSKFSIGFQNLNIVELLPKFYAFSESKRLSGPILRIEEEFYCSLEEFENLKQVRGSYKINFYNRKKAL